MSNLPVESKCQYCTFTTSSSRDVGACDLCPPELRRFDYVDFNELLIHKIVRHGRLEGGELPNFECRFCPFRAIDAGSYNHHMKREHGRCAAHFRCYENRCLKIISFDFFSNHIDNVHPPLEQLQFESDNMGETISLFGNLDSSFNAHSFYCHECCKTLTCSSLVECNLCANLPNDQQYAGFAKINDFLIHLQNEHGLNFTGKLICTFKETGCKFVGSLAEVKRHVVSDHNSCASHVCCSPSCSILLDPQNYKKAHIKPDQCQYVEPNTSAFRSFIGHFQKLQPKKCGQLKSGGGPESEKSKSKKVLYFKRNGPEVGKLFYAPVLKLPIAKIDYFTKYFAYRCESCPFVVQLSEESSKLTHHSCPFCHLVFFTLLEAKSHIAQYHRYTESESKSKCSECPFLADSSDKVIRHRLLAHKFCKEHYLCVAHKSCNKLFSTSRKLGRHVISQDCVKTDETPKEGLLGLAPPENLYKCTSCSFSQALDPRNFVQCNRCNDHGRVFLVDEVDFAIHKYLRFQQDMDEMIYLQCPDKTCAPKWLRLRDYFNHRDQTHQSCGIHYVCRYKDCRVLMSSLHSLNLHQDMCTKRDNGIRGEELLTHHLHSEIQNLICTYSQSLVSMRYEKYACSCCNELFESSLLVLCKLCSFDISPVVFIDSSEFLSHLVLIHKIDCQSKVDCYLTNDGAPCTYSGKVTDAYNHKLIKHGICGFHIKCPFSDCNFLFDDIEKMLKHRNSANHFPQVKPIEKFFVTTIGTSALTQTSRPVNADMVNYFLELPFKTLPRLPENQNQSRPFTQVPTFAESSSKTLPSAPQYVERHSRPLIPPVASSSNSRSRYQTSPNDVNEIMPLGNDVEEPSAILHASDPRIVRNQSLLSKFSNPQKELTGTPRAPGKMYVTEFKTLAWTMLEIRSRSTSPEEVLRENEQEPMSGHGVTKVIPWGEAGNSASNEEHVHVWPPEPITPIKRATAPPPFAKPRGAFAASIESPNKSLSNLSGDEDSKLQNRGLRETPLGYNPKRIGDLGNEEAAFTKDIDQRQLAAVFGNSSTQSFKPTERPLAYVQSHSVTNDEVDRANCTTPVLDEEENVLFTKDDTDFLHFVDESIKRPETPEKVKLSRVHQHGKDTSSKKHSPPFAKIGAGNETNNDMPRIANSDSGNDQNDSPPVTSPSISDTVSKPFSENFPFKESAKGRSGLGVPDATNIGIPRDISAMIESFRKASSSNTPHIPVFKEPFLPKPLRESVTEKTEHATVITSQSSKLPELNIPPRTLAPKVTIAENELKRPEPEGPDPLAPENETGLLADAYVEAGPFISDEANGIVYGHFVLLTVTAKSIVQSSNKFKYYTCSKCGFYRDLQSLLVVHHFICSECDMAFMSQFEATYHFCKVHSHPIPKLKEKAECEKCNYSSDSLEHWIDHRMERHGFCKEHIVCPGAGCLARNVFTSKRDFEEHLSRGGCLKKLFHKFDALNSPYYANMHKREDFLCQQTCIACTFTQYKEFDGQVAITHPKCCADETFVTKEDRECHGASIHFKNSAQMFKKMKHSCVNCDLKFPVLLAMMHKVYNHVVCSEHYACPNNSCMLVFPCPNLVKLHHKTCIMTFFTFKQKDVMQRLLKEPPKMPIVKGEWKATKERMIQKNKETKELNENREKRPRMSSDERTHDRFSNRRYDQPPRNYPPRNYPDSRNRYDESSKRYPQPRNRLRDSRPRSPKPRSISPNRPFYQQNEKREYEEPRSSFSKPSVEPTESSTKENNASDFDFENALNRMRRESSVHSNVSKGEGESSRSGNANSRPNKRRRFRSRSRSTSNSAMSMSRSDSRSRSRSPIRREQTSEQNANKDEPTGLGMDDFLKQARYGK